MSHQFASIATEPSPQGTWLGGPDKPSDGLLSQFLSDLEHLKRTQNEAIDRLMDAKGRVFGHAAQKAEPGVGPTPTPACLAPALGESIQHVRLRANLLLSLAEELNARL